MKTNLTSNEMYSLQSLMCDKWVLTDSPSQELILSVALADNNISAIIFNTISDANHHAEYVKSKLGTLHNYPTIHSLINTHSINQNSKSLVINLDSFLRVKYYVTRQHYVLDTELHVDTEMNLTRISPKNYLDIIRKGIVTPKNGSLTVTNMLTEYLNQITYLSYSTTTRYRNYLLANFVLENNRDYLTDSKRIILLNPQSLGIIECGASYHELLYFLRIKHNLITYVHSEPQLIYSTSRLLRNAIGFTASTNLLKLANSNFVLTPSTLVTDTVNMYDSLIVPSIVDILRNKWFEENGKCQLELLSELQLNYLESSKYRLVKPKTMRELEHLAYKLADDLYTKYTQQITLSS